MRLYTSLGDLLMAYRNKYNLSQGELAGLIDVDIRTVQRWERNVTLVKPEKEPDLVEATLLPHQLIRNLNSTFPIPTYYDFDLRKYSLTELDIELPDTSLLKKRINLKSEHVHKINTPEELKKVIQYTNARYEPKHQINDKVLSEACKLLPGLNLFVNNMYGFYSGHSLILPLKEEAFHNLKNKKINNSDLSINDLVDYRSLEKPIFYIYSVTADSNASLIFLMATIFRFFLKLSPYTIGTMTTRNDNKAFNQTIGLKLLWSEEGFGSEDYYNFWEGDLNDYLKRVVNSEKPGTKKA